MVHVPVNPRVLEWARLERGLTTNQAAQKLDISGEELTALETGESQPTIGTLQKIAQKYEISFVSLLMPAPLPQTARQKLRDFRVFDGENPKALSQETIVAIEEVDEYIEALSEIRDTDTSIVPDISAPHYQISENPETVAEKERKRLDVENNYILDLKTDRDAFLFWRELLENSGIFVYQMKLGADGSRGFAVWDERKVAAIVVDASEGTYGPKSFTLLHEYAHILLRAGGISDQNRNNRTERFCNKFAAAFLMPREEFSKSASIYKNRDELDVSNADKEVSALARRFKVSKQAAALRLEDLGIVRAGYYGRLLALWGAGSRSTGGIATHEQRLVNRLGSHIEVVLNALEKGIINKIDAFEYTRIKPRYFSAVRGELAERRAKYAKRA